MEINHEKINELEVVFSSGKIKLLGLPIKNACIIQFFSFRDERGAFYKRIDSETLNFLRFHVHEFLCSSSIKGVVRGLHFQSNPISQAKIVYCTKGRIFDVLVDLRQSSPTFKKWVGIYLDEQNPYAVYIPRGCAHGFYALTDCEVTYLADNSFSKEHDYSLKWNDPEIGIKWPFSGEPILSEKDKNAVEFSKCPLFP